MPRYYAEDEVDRLVRENFYPDLSYRGIFVEVGAAGPEYLSMSQHFLTVAGAFWRLNPTHISVKHIAAKDIRYFSMPPVVKIVTTWIFN